MSTQEAATHATFELCHTWAMGPAHTTPGTIEWVKRDLPGLAAALGILRSTGPRRAPTQAVIEAWLSTPTPLAEQLAANWPELRDALDDLYRVARTEERDTP